MKLKRRVLRLLFFHTYLLTLPSEDAIITITL